MVFKASSFFNSSIIYVQDMMTCSSQKHTLKDGYKLQNCRILTFYVVFQLGLKEIPTGAWVAGSLPTNNGRPNPGLTYWMATIELAVIQYVNAMKLSNIAKISTVQAYFQFMMVASVFRPFTIIIMRCPHPVELMEQVVQM